MNIFLDLLYLNLKFFLSLLIVINPLGMIPIFTTFTYNKTLEERKKINYITNLAVAVILCVSIVYGVKILEIFSISIQSFRIAGGLLTLSTAFSMLNGTLFKNDSENSTTESIDNESKNCGIAIVPLAIPLIAGPGAISTVMMWGIKYSNFFYTLGFCVTILIFSFLSWLFFELAPSFIKFLGKTGILVITRIMSLLLMSLGIEFIIGSLRFLFFNN